MISFCQGFGFEAALSDRGDVFYHPDLHTHEACVGEVANCHLLILVIGGRFGGSYIADKTKSITNAEYSAARHQNIPVFAFIKQDVLNDHNVWQRNKDQPFSSEIIYPSIDKQEHAVDVFSFIDVVRHSEVNNGFFGFRVARDLEELLRKQLAGMFFDFLTRRNISKQIQSTSDTVNSLTVVANTIEQLVKSLYRQVNNQSAEVAIETVDAAAKGESFFVEIASILNDKDIVLKNCIDRVIKQNAEDWKLGLVSGGLFQLGFNEARIKRTVSSALPPGAEKMLTYLGTRAVCDADGDVIDKDSSTTKRLAEDWATFRALPEETRRQILSRYSYEARTRPGAAEKTPDLEF
jgi:hypothetical protein